MGLRALLKETLRAASPLLHVRTQSGGWDQEVGSHQTPDLHTVRSGTSLPPELCEAQFKLTTCSVVRAAQVGPKRGIADSSLMQLRG